MPDATWNGPDMGRQRWCAMVVRAKRDGLWSDGRVALVSIIGAWSVFLAFTVLRLTIIRFPHELRLTERNAVTVCFGAGLCWPLYIVLRRLHRAPIALRIATGTLLALPLATALTVITFWIRYGVAPEQVFAIRDLQTVTPRNFFAREITELFLMFAGWSALYSSVTSAIEGREADERAAQAEIGRRDAQLAALRYQLSPHFLFNVLNSISALVLRGDAPGADRAIGMLSSFLRTTLAEDGDRDLSLAEELERHRLYLAIEQVRFGERLQVRWAVPPELLAVRMPSLLLQPVIENVVRHAVGATEAVVTMEVRAFARDGVLHLSVQDDGPGRSATGGHGIGLSNVASRLAARYDARARLRYGARRGGGFQVELVLPLGDADVPG